MKNILKYTLLLFLPALAACSNEEDGTMPATAQPQPGDALELTVSASDFITYGSPHTRATDEGLKTTFDNGDRIGITCLDANGNILANNVPYKYDNGTWTFDRNNGESKSQCYYEKETVTYLAYYPYNKAANNIKTLEALKQALPPQVNQNTLAAYRASDLMTWSTTLTTLQSTLSIELKHAYAMLSISDDKKSYPEGTFTILNLNLTIGNEVCALPYYNASEGTCRYIFPADIKGDICPFYTLNGKSYSTIITPQGAIAANTRYTFTIAANTPKEIDLSKISAKEYTVSSWGVPVIVRGGSKPKDLRLTVESGIQLTLDNVVLASQTDGDVITCKGNTTITLSGTNSLSGKGWRKSGILVTSGTLILQGNGKLTATGDGGGICAKNNANITIKSGTITAKCADNGEGVGIGTGKDGICGTITINGGTIEAHGTSYSAGIGSANRAGAGGNTGSCGNIIITGGNIKAYGGTQAPGIGNGSGSNCGTITISGKTTEVYAQKGQNGALSCANSIGYNGYSGSCGVVTIGAECDVTQE